MNYIDVPAHRVLRVTKEELAEQFTFLQEDGKACNFGEIIYRILRKDGKLFVIPQHHRYTDYNTDYCYLQEI